MLLLAIDTSGAKGSLALARAENHDFECLALVPLTGRMYSAELIPRLSEALKHSHLEKQQIDAYVVATGPGSFTGLRVGLSTVKALAESFRKPIAAVSLLEAAARIANAAGKVTVAVDAGRKQVYVGEYDFAPNFAVQDRRESLVDLDAFFHLLAAGKDAPGLLVTPDSPVAAEARGHGLDIRLIDSPQADTFARIGYEKIQGGETLTPDQLEPNYIRASDAELFSLPKIPQNRLG